MILEIEHNTTVGDLQKHFSSSFPFLKLTIYKDVGRADHTHKMSEITDSKLLVNQFRKRLDDVFLEIHYWQQIKTVVKIFHDKAGLTIHIKRKQGEHWIETNGTDQLTLEEQNDIGRKATQESLHGLNRPIEFEKPA